MATFADQCRNGDYAGVTERINYDYCCNMQPTEVAQLFRSQPCGDESVRTRWSSCTWWMWVKNRISERYPELLAGPGCDTSSNLTTCTMHVFFLFLHETPEMLARLKNEAVAEESRVARSKIFKLNRQPSPVDSTAARVAATDSFDANRKDVL